MVSVALNVFANLRTKKVSSGPTTAVHAAPANVSFAWAPVVAAQASADRRDTR
jgi:hypothetical protein